MQNYLDISITTLILYQHTFWYALPQQYEREQHTDFSEASLCTQLQFSLLLALSYIFFNKAQKVHVSLLNIWQNIATVS